MLTRFLCIVNSILSEQEEEDIMAYVHDISAAALAERKLFMSLDEIVFMLKENVSRLKLSHVLFGK